MNDDVAVDSKTGIMRVPPGHVAFKAAVSTETIEMSVINRSRISLLVL